jgi:hypothetical protein
MIAASVAHTTASTPKREPSPSTACGIAASDSAEAGAGLERGETSAFEQQHPGPGEPGPVAFVERGSAVTAPGRGEVVAGAAGIGAPAGANTTTLTAIGLPVAKAVEV